jgi:2-phospho-L-lactate/phosphoenolpyruvate guanylyltransferase
MMLALVIPVKSFQNAKCRLAGLLSPSERAELAYTMFLDVADSLSRAPVIAAGKEVQVVLLSNAQAAIEHARSMGWEILLEEQQSSESESIDQASRLLKRRGFQGVLRLPADVPLITVEDVQQLLHLASISGPVLLVPSHEGTGTNALLRRPPDLFPSRFGPGSLLLHQEEARRAGVEPQIARIARIAMDIDEPADLRRLLAESGEQRTLQLLKRWQLRERMDALEVS